MGARCRLLPWAIALWIATTPVVAQSRGGPPNSGLEVRLGWFFLQGESDFWEETGEVFTLDPSDFDDFTVGLTYQRTLSNRVELGFNVDFYGQTVRSQYRSRCTDDPTFLCLDEQGLPILHDSELTMVPLTVDVRFFPAGRYRRGESSTGWQPRPAFYLGGGVGVNFWEYREYGDFIDFSFDPPTVIPGDFRDKGTELQLHALVGVELPIGSGRSNFVVEFRHSWAEAELGRDFSGLGTIDLGGTSVYGGFAFRF